MTELDPRNTQIAGLLAPAFAPTRAVLAALEQEQLTAPSPCAEWTVRNVADHLIGALEIFAGLAEGETTVDFTALERQHTELTSAFDEASKRCMAAFNEPGILETELPFPGGSAPASLHAHIAVSESLIHGWDLATGAGLDYTPDPSVVTAIAEFQHQGDEAERRAEGMYGPAVAAPKHADEFGRLLAFLGREAMR